jgi:aspartyl-tRNA(Asn)/glutamyl-tRNA(Gln) amidotransferase subunit C
MKKQELYTTAALAQLELDEQEAGILADEITRVLDYFAKMEEVDVSGLPPTTHALIKENCLRQDKEEAGQKVDPDDLVEAAPEIDDRFIIIPNVL